MWKLTIEDDEQKATTLPLSHDEYAVGRDETNSIRLTDRNISRQHARVLFRGGQYAIVDNGSNAIAVNNNAAAVYLVLNEMAAGQEVIAEARSGDETRWADAREKSGAKRYYLSETPITRRHASLGWTVDGGGPLDWHTQLRAYRSALRADNARTSGVAALRPNELDDRVVEGQASLTPAVGQQTTAGFELRREALRNIGLPGGEGRADHRSLYAQHEAALTPALGLTAGLRYSVVQPIYQDSEFRPAPAAGLTPIEDRATADNTVQRLGPVVSYTFFDRGYTGFNKPSLLLVVAWYLDHRYRAGQAAAAILPGVFVQSPAMPYIVLGFSFQSDLINRQDNRRRS